MSKVNIGITIGDINGVGPEVIIKTLADDRIMQQCDITIFGDGSFLNYYKNIVGEQQFKFFNLNKWEGLNHKIPNVVSVIDDKVNIEPGQATEVSGRVALKAVDSALEALKEGHIQALVTAPLNKHNIPEIEDHKFTGHTEYIAKFFEAEESLMFLTHEALRVGLATNHVPLQEVSKVLSPDTILKKLRIMNESLKRDFLINQPKIAVLGLNPHAGDNNLLGSEETDIIMPAIAKAKEEDMFIIGPFAADGFFGSGHYRQFDGIIAMYHDQGLVPFKTISFSKGVNFTAGLPIVRTSPDHGTAYDVAGKGIADPGSFRTALFQAIDVYRNRLQYDEMTANPVKPHKKGKK